jgi:branched-chain amino acid transport system substrate-binding protein
MEARSGTHLSRRGMTRRRFGTLTAASTASLVCAPRFISGARAAGVLKIVQIEPLTGPSAPYGIRCRDGARLAADDINAKGGVDVKGNKYTIEITTGDMANDAHQAITLFRQFAADPSMLATVGPGNSVGFVPLVPLADQMRMPLIADGSGALIKQWNPWSYRINPVAITAVPILLKAVVAKNKIKRLGVIYDQTQDGQVADAEICKREAGALGYEVVSYQAFRSGDQDFSAQIADIRNAKPDAIYVASTTGDGVKVVTQIRESRLAVPLLTGYGSFQDTVYWDGTNGQVKGSYTWLSQDLNSPEAALKDFLERYNKRFPQEATSFSVYGYDSLTALAMAISNAGVLEREPIKDAMSRLDVTTVLGTHVTFKNPPIGDNQTPAVQIVEITGRGSYTHL